MFGQNPTASGNVFSFETLSNSAPSSSKFGATSGTSFGNPGSNLWGSGFTLSSACKTNNSHGFGSSFPFGDQKKLKTVGFGNTSYFGNDQQSSSNEYKFGGSKFGCTSASFPQSSSSHLNTSENSAFGSNNASSNWFRDGIKGNPAFGGDNKPAKFGPNITTFKEKNPTWGGSNGGFSCWNGYGAQGKPVFGGGPAYASFGQMELDSRERDAVCGNSASNWNGYGQAQGKLPFGEGPKFGGFGQRTFDNGKNIDRGFFVGGTSSVFNAQPQEQVKNFSFGCSDPISSSIPSRTDGNLIDISVSVSGTEKENHSLADKNTQTVIKFKPFEGTDTMIKGRATINVHTKINVITAMKEYETESIEELRVKDYLMGFKDWTRKQEQPQGFNFGFANALDSGTTVPNPSGDEGFFGMKQQENKSFFGKSQEVPAVFGTDQTTESSSKLFESGGCNLCDQVMKNALNNQVNLFGKQNDQSSNENKGINIFSNCLTGAGASQWRNDNRSVFGFNVNDHARKPNGLTSTTSSGWHPWKPFVSYRNNNAGESSFEENRFTKSSVEGKDDEGKNFKGIYNELKRYIDFTMNKLIVEMGNSKDERIKELENTVKDLELEKEVFKSNRHPSQPYDFKRDCTPRVARRRILRPNQEMHELKDLRASFERLKNDMQTVKDVIREYKMVFEAQTKDTDQNSDVCFTDDDSGDPENDRDCNAGSESFKDVFNQDECLKEFKDSVKHLEQEMKLLKISANKLTDKSSNVGLKHKSRDKDDGAHASCSNREVLAKSLRGSSKNVIKSRAKDKLAQQKVSMDEDQEKPWPKEDKKILDQIKSPCQPGLGSISPELDIELKNTLMSILDDVRILKHTFINFKQEDRDKLSDLSDDALYH